MEFGKVVFDFQKAVGEGNEIIGQVTNFGVKAFIGFVVKCVQTRLQVINIFIVIGNHGGESAIWLLFQF